MTGTELIDRILKRLGDDPTADISNMYYTPAEILTALNQMQRLFVLLTLCLEVTSPFVLSGSSPFYRMLTVYPDWIVPLRLRIGTKKMKPRRLADLAALDSNWTIRTGTTEAYSHSGTDLLAVYKRPASTVTASMTYARSPVDMTDDTEPEIPIEFHPALILGAIPLLRIKEGGSEWQKTLPLWSDFMAAVKLCADQVRKRNLEQGHDAMPPEPKRYDMSHLKTKVG